MKSYKITKGILDDLFGTDAEYMNDLAQLNVMNTKGLSNRNHRSLSIIHCVPPNILVFGFLLI